MRIILAIINGIPEQLPCQADTLADLERAVRLYCIDRCTSYMQADATVPDWPQPGRRAVKLRGYERLVVLDDSPVNKERLTGG